LNPYFRVSLNLPVQLGRRNYVISTLVDVFTQEERWRYEFLWLEVIDMEGEQTWVCRVLERLGSCGRRNLDGDFLVELIRPKVREMVTGKFIEELKKAS
jgi:hypothetical protein